MLTNEMLVTRLVEMSAEEICDLASAPVTAVPEELARAVRQRRAELRLSQREVRESSGLSVTTISKIERGERDLVVQRATLRRLDLALQWPVGTAESWYDGRAGVLSSDARDSLVTEAGLELLLPVVIEALAARSDYGLALLSNLARLPLGVRRTIEVLVAELAEALNPR